MRAAHVVVVAAVATGCGRIAFDELGSTPDAGATCWSSWHSGVTLELPALRGDLNTSANDKNPFLSADRRTMYFASDRAGGQGGLDFWSAQRTDPAGTFSVVGPISSLNSTFGEGRLEVDTSELVAVFSTGRPGAGLNDIYVATRANTSSAFVIDPLITAALNTAGEEKDPHFLGGSSTRLYYNVEDSGFRVADRVGNGAFGPGRVVDLVVPSADIFADPQPSPDELTLVFSSGTASNPDFFVATRDSTSEPFVNSVPLTAISTPSLDRDISVTNDGCEVWYSTSPANDEILVTHVVP